MHSTTAETRKKSQAQPGAWLPLPQGTRTVVIAMLLATCLLLQSVTALASPSQSVHAWNAEEIKTLRSLRLAALPKLPPDPSNRVADDPRAVALGKKLFFDGRFSGNAAVSCATCHRPDFDFTDDRPLAQGMGATKRRSMPLAGLAYSPFLFWDGRKDSLWSQALGPIESSVEHGSSRTLAAKLLAANYRQEYQALFGPMPAIPDKLCPSIARPAIDNPEAQEAWSCIPVAKRAEINRIYANMGKTIAAYVRRILPGPSRFDQYAEAALRDDQTAMAALFSDQEAKGLRLFMGQGACTNCHNGPLLTNFDFHDIGLPDPAGSAPDLGRAAGISQVGGDPFNCLGPYSDADPEQCGALLFMSRDVVKYRKAFKTPTLRNVALRPPYMHAGQFATLTAVLKHYQAIRLGRMQAALPPGPSFSDDGVIQMEAFLRTLTGRATAP